MARETREGSTMLCYVHVCLCVYVATINFDFLRQQDTLSQNITQHHITQHHQRKKAAVSNDRRLF